MNTIELLSIPIPANFADILTAASKGGKYKSRKGHACGLQLAHDAKLIHVRPDIMLDICGVVSSLGVEETDDERTKEEKLQHAFYIITEFRQQEPTHMHIFFSQQTLSNFIGLENCSIPIKMPDDNIVYVDLKTVEFGFQLGKIAGALEYMQRGDTEKKLPNDFLEKAWKKCVAAESPGKNKGSTRGEDFACVSNSFFDDYWNTKSLSVMLLLWLYRLQDPSFLKIMKDLARYIDFMGCIATLYEGTDDRFWGIGMQKRPEDRLMYDTVLGHMTQAILGNPQAVPVDFGWPGQNNINKIFHEVIGFMTGEDGSLLDDDAIMAKVRTLPPLFYVMEEDQPLVPAKRPAEGEPEPGAASSVPAPSQQPEPEAAPASVQRVETVKPSPPAPSSWDKFGDW